jgi:hypothetical protein
VYLSTHFPLNGSGVDLGVEILQWIMPKVSSSKIPILFLSAVIDLCNNPLTKENKMDYAKKHIPIWNEYVPIIDTLESELNLLLYNTKNQNKSEYNNDDFAVLNQETIMYWQHKIEDWKSTIRTFENNSKKQKKKF